MCYTIIDSRCGSFRKDFATKASCKAWLTEGLYGTDGAERGHYVGMLCQMEDGRNVLDYNGDYTW